MFKCVKDGSIRAIFSLYADDALQNFRYVLFAFTSHRRLIWPARTRATSAEYTSSIYCHLWPSMSAGNHLPASKPNKQTWPNWPNCVCVYNPLMSLSQILQCETSGVGGSSEVFHDANKIIWQRSQTPELFALKTEWRQGTGGVVMTFWGMSPETVGRAEAFGRGKKKSTICVFDPASVDVLWESVPGECQVCTEKTVHRGGRWFVRLGPCVIYCEALGKKTLGLQWLGRASAHCSFWFRRTKKQRKKS